MNDFFRSKTFKIIAVLLAAVLAFFLRAVYTGGLMPALSHIGGAVATPFGEFFAGIGNGIQDFFQPIFHGRELQKENEDLQKLVDELTRRQADYDELKNQNDLYRRFFSISDSNADYTLEPATVIAHVPDDPSGSFIINIGQSQGITSGMPVITENGLVGIVGRVSERYCRVLTLMDPAVNIGVLDSTTLDTGILTGDAAMSEDNTARLTYLRLQSEAAAGDLILTSGYGEQIPQGLTVGYLSEVSLAATGLTLEGVIDLSARPENARQVFVITDFTVTQTPSEEVPPEEIKAFYMKLNPDGKTVAAMDCLVPGIGEIIGGSQREDNYDTLLQRMHECGLKEKDYQFYLDLRKYGSPRHAGFGLGFERCVMYLTGISNIRDVLPFPRTVGNCEL